jgi:hypothetical protein
MFRAGEHIGPVITSRKCAFETKTGAQPWPNHLRFDDQPARFGPEYRIRGALVFGMKAHIAHVNLDALWTLRRCEPQFIPALEEQQDVGRVVCQKTQLSGVPESHKA